MGMKTKLNNQNLSRYARQFGLRSWHHTYSFWLSHGYDPSVTY